MKKVDLNNKISFGELNKIAQEMFSNLVKAVVDVKNQAMVVGGELYADEEKLLLDQGSQQADLWGINLYPELYPRPDWIEFDSVINLRPAWGNKSQGVDNPKIRKKVRQLVKMLINKK